MRGKLARRSSAGKKVQKKLEQVQVGRVKAAEKAVEKKKAMKAREEQRKVLSEKHKQKAELAREASEMR
eukprot:COSAG06_NODE_47435_length_339_cov_0.829167_1_plen_68_part_10